MRASSKRATPPAFRKPDAYPRCQHRPACPAAEATDREAAHPVACHPEQGWSLLCNGVLLFEDTGELLPDGRIIQPHRSLSIDARAAA
ncbi:hypothetical protein TPA0598_04_03410 [Streptomyces lydicamycinicus]|uniref:Uncharacterized protein n=1 Tax=Streptomyces lydicamycinicus TaxID=1546107 RepID=A0A0P4R6E5_9ACTN|nr:hypothetical protein TPA0598_04_03410 [Streptomyces lydicamycinicus]